MSEYAQGSDAESGTRSNELVMAFGTAAAAVRRRWWLVIGVFALVVSVTMWRTMRQPRRYQATAVVQLEQQPRPDIVNQQPTWADMINPVSPIQSAQQLIKSQ